ncbi:MAG: hypothetical protein M3416_06305 [Acidobacteriota bacterium]|nr:hypothetical protein [Acidobacteriota bacterium]
MSYQGPMLIREPELRWPVILVAATITTLIVLATAGVMHLALTSPAVTPAARPRLEGALRPGMPAFEQFRKQMLVEQVVVAEVLCPTDEAAVEVRATLRNTTGRTVTGLEVRGAVLDARMAPLGERTAIVVPTGQTAIEPGEAIGVRLLLEGIRPEAERAGALMEITAVRFD